MGRACAVLSFILLVAMFLMDIIFAVNILSLSYSKVDLTKWGLAEIHSPKMLRSSDSPVPKLT